MTGRVLLLGSGMLARAICYSLAVDSLPMRVTIAARNGALAGEIAYVANARAAVTDSPVRCQALTSELSDPLQLSRAMRAAAPDLVLLAASYQSPWERLTAPSAWTALLDRAGFGLTAPIHALLSATVAQAVADSGRARLLLACFPDVVSPMLAALGLPVLSGVGNVALLTASLRAALELGSDARLRVLAHHVHLHSPARPAEELRAWIGDEAVADVTMALSAQRATRRRELNMVTGHVTATLIRALLRGNEFCTSLPGPLGLPGGYPVRISDHIELDLPDGITPEAAVEWNRAAGRRDGVDVHDGEVRFTDQVCAALEPHLPGLTRPFPVSALAQAGGQLLSLRATLRNRPGSDSCQANHHHGSGGRNDNHS
jgi:hypothetical protein